VEYLVIENKKDTKAVCGVNGCLANTICAVVACVANTVPCAANACTINY